MKKYLKTTLPIVFIILLGYFGFQIASKINHKKQIAENIKTIPTFSYENVKGGLFSNKNIIANEATLFIYYNSECEFCNEEAKMIKENISKFSNIQLVFISNESPKNIIAFATKHKLYNHDSISFLSDTKMSFRTTFDVKSLPCLVLHEFKNNYLASIQGGDKIIQTYYKLSEKLPLEDMTLEQSIKTFNLIVSDVIPLVNNLKTNPTSGQILIDNVTNTKLIQYLYEMKQIYPDIDSKNRIQNLINKVNHFTNKSNTFVTSNLNDF